MGGPALIINPADGFFIADFWGFILSIPVALFLAFWMSSVKSRAVVVLGAFIGSFIGFLVILAWAGTLIYDTDLPNTSPVSVFFGAVLICSVGGLAAGIIADLLVAQANKQDYRRQISHE